MKRPPGEDGPISANFGLSENFNCLRRQSRFGLTEPFKDLRPLPGTTARPRIYF